MVFIVYDHYQKVIMERIFKMEAIRSHYILHNFLLKNCASIKKIEKKLESGKDLFNKYGALGIVIRPES